MQLEAGKQIDEVRAALLAFNTDSYLKLPRAAQCEYLIARIDVELKKNLEIIAPVPNDAIWNGKILSKMCRSWY